MSFEFAKYLWAALALLLPFLIHFINKKEGKNVLVGNIDWFETGESRKASSIHPRDLWLMLMRMLCIACLVLILLSPFLREKQNSGDIKKIEQLLLVQNEAEFASLKKQDVSIFPPSFSKVLVGDNVYNLKSIDSIQSIDWQKSWKIEPGSLHLLFNKVDQHYAHLKQLLIVGNRSNFHALDESLSLTYELNFIDLPEIERTELSESSLVLQNSSTILQFGEMKFSNNSLDSIGISMYGDLALEEALESLKEFQGVPLKIDSSASTLKIVEGSKEVSSDQSIHFRYGSNNILSSNGSLSLPEYLALAIGQEVQALDPPIIDQRNRVNIPVNKIQKKFSHAQKEAVIESKLSLVPHFWLLLLFLLLVERLWSNSKLKK